MKSEVLAGEVADPAVRERICAAALTCLRPVIAEVYVDLVTDLGSDDLPVPLDEVSARLRQEEVRQRPHRADGRRSRRGAEATNVTIRVDGTREFELLAQFAAYSIYAEATGLQGERLLTFQDAASSIWFVAEESILACIRERLPQNEHRHLATRGVP